MSSSIQAFTFLLFLPSAWNSKSMMATRILAIIKLGVRSRKKGKKKKNLKIGSQKMSQFSLSNFLWCPTLSLNLIKCSFMDTCSCILIKKSSVLFSKEEGESGGFGKQWVVHVIVGMQASYCSISLVRLLSFNICIYSGCL